MPALLVELRAKAVPPIVEYPAARGFEVFPEPIDPGPRGRVRLCLILTDARFRDVFGVLVDDIIANLRDCPREDDVVRRMLARLHVWQVFMRRHGPGELDGKRNPASRPNSYSFGTGFWGDCRRSMRSGDGRDLVADIRTLCFRRLLLRSKGRLHQAGRMCKFHRGAA